VLTDATGLVLSWESVKEAASYHVYRSIGADSWQPKFDRVAMVQKTLFSDHKIPAKESAVYMVRAVDDKGIESDDSLRARATPRVTLRPVVSVLANDHIEVSWNRHPAPDIAGYNLYRGVVTVRTVKKGEPKPWRDNDPGYDEPRVAEVADISDIRKLNDGLLTDPSYADRADVSKPLPGSKDYKHAVYAYLVRAVNKLGVESGPSPYALTIPSEPTSVFNREKGGMAELKWAANPEKGIAGYHVYKLEGTWNIVRLTTEPIQATTFTHKSPQTRYWITAVDALGQEGQPSSPVWHQRRYAGFFSGEWHQ
jgi:fibronectin type 3 domain-containing protein